jgi:LysM repeat protein
MLVSLKHEFLRSLMMAASMTRHLRNLKNEIDIMNNQRSIRFWTLLLIAGIMAAVLTACELSASEGPEVATPVGGNFPVPGGEQNMGGLDVSAFSTQTAQAMITPPVIQQGTPYAPPAVTDTPVPGAPAESAAPEQPAAQTTYIQATPGGPPASYTLQAGEFVYCIARRFDVNPFDLLILNGLSEGTVLQPGTTLRIPTSSSWPGDRSLINHPGNYTVKTGDTIYSIACAFGDVSPDMIALQNGLAAPYALTTGQVLVIP